MTQDQTHRILEILAYNFGEMYKNNKTPTTNECNWENARLMFDTEMRINGEEFLLSLLEDKKDEDKN